MLLEDTYGRRKRQDFVTQVVREIEPGRILDVGCGTGAGLTCALGESFPDRDIIGIDSDAVSIHEAQTNSHPSNVTFVLGDSIPGGDGYSLVIAAEVLEHVDDPGLFLREIAAHTRLGGRIVVTVPNGYGPFEICSLVEVMLNLSGLQRVLRSLKRALSSRVAPSETTAPLTLAISPHVNFFSFREVLGLFEAAGLRVRRYRASSFLCGYGLDLLIRGRSVVEWNARIADRLPTWCVSDWMFELALDGEPRPIAWKRGRWGRFRRHLNRVRWGLS